MTTGKPDSSKRWLYLFAVYIIWGSTYLAMKIGTEIVPPFLLSAFRFVLAGGILSCIGYRREKQWPQPRQWACAALVGLLLIGIGNSSTAVAVHYMPSGLVALIVAAIPAWFVGMDWAFFSRRRPAAMTILGILIGFAGLFLLFNPFARETVRNYPLWPVGLVAFGSISWALGSLLVPRLPMPAQVTSTAIQMLAGGLLCFILSALLEPGAWKTLPRADLRTWAAYGYLVGIGSLVGFTSYSWLTRNAPPRLTATYAYVNPVVALFLGWAIAHEKLSGMALLACVIVIAGVVLMTIGRNNSAKNRTAD